MEQWKHAEQRWRGLECAIYTTEPDGGFPWRFSMGFHGFPWRDNMVAKSLVSIPSLMTKRDADSIYSRAKHQLLGLRPRMHG